MVISHGMTMNELLSNWEINLTRTHYHVEFNIEI